MFSAQKSFPEWHLSFRHLVYWIYTVEKEKPCAPVQGFLRLRPAENRRVWIGRHFSAGITCCRTSGFSRCDIRLRPFSAPSIQPRRFIFLRFPPENRMSSPLKREIRRNLHIRKEKKVSPKWHLSFVQSGILKLEIRKGKPRAPAGAFPFALEPRT